MAPLSNERWKHELGKAIRVDTIRARMVLGLNYSDESDDSDESDTDSGEKWAKPDVMSQRDYAAWCMLFEKITGKMRKQDAARSLARGFAEFERRAGACGRAACASRAIAFMSRVVVEDIAGAGDGKRPWHTLYRQSAMRVILRRAAGGVVDRHRGGAESGNAHPGSGGGQDGARGGRGPDQDGTGDGGQVQRGLHMAMAVHVVFSVRVVPAGTVWGRWTSHSWNVEASTLLVKSMADEDVSTWSTKARGDKQRKRKERGMHPYPARKRWIHTCWLKMSCEHGTQHLAHPKPDDTTACTNSVHEPTVAHLALEDAEVQQARCAWQRYARAVLAFYATYPAVVVLARQCKAPRQPDIHTADHSANKIADYSIYLATKRFIFWDFML
ncbi:hypothetical protein K438DRAFT_2071334 [Mycena galopus ATCC 62051]|nr:hypothetical protein K438DRAFT_2071334 [Mycena galopus ATCC 62051]